MDLGNVFQGPVHSLSLWDDTNKELLLGFVGAEVSIDQKPLVHKLVDGTEKMYSIRTELEAELWESNAHRIAQLRDRQGTRQDIYVVTADNVYKFKNAFIQWAEARSMDAKEYHRIVLTAVTEIQDHFGTVTNLLNQDLTDSTPPGSFEDANDLEDGWSEYGSGWTTGPSKNGSTFLSSGGGSDCQRFDNDGGGTGSGIYFDAVCPLEAEQIKITVSVYLRSVSSAYTIFWGLATKDNAGSIVNAISSDSASIPTTGDNRKSKTITLTPGSGVAKLSIYIFTNTNSASWLMDNAQLQIGALTDYTENK